MFTVKVPVTDAGTDQTVDAGISVSLDATASFDPEGAELAFQWTQVSGPPVTLVET